LIRERVMMGLDRARKQGKKLGRPATRVETGEILQLRANGLSLRNIAETLGVSHTLIARFLRGDQVMKRVPSGHSCGPDQGLSVSSPDTLA
jgi:DNA invertase Pin-like site-specific DNA recombinase